MKTFIFGNITFGEFTIGSDVTRMAIVNSMGCIVNLEDDVCPDDYMIENHHDSYLDINSDIEIVYSKTYLQNLVKCV